MGFIDLWVHFLSEPYLILPARHPQNGFSSFEVPNLLILPIAANPNSPHDPLLFVALLDAFHTVAPFLAMSWAWMPKGLSVPYTRSIGEEVAAKVIAPFPCGDGAAYKCSVAYQCTIALCSCSCADTLTFMHLRGRS